jgi:hypothetical protein
MWAIIIKVLYEIIAQVVKQTSGPITATVAPAVPATVRDRWNKRVRDWQKASVRAGK